jgi:hypothetical protein
LEAGAKGIFLPEIDTVEDVKKAADAGFLPPKGNRGICPAVLAVHYNGPKSAAYKQVLETAKRNNVAVIGGPISNTDKKALEDGITIFSLELDSQGFRSYCQEMVNALDQAVAGSRYTRPPKRDWDFKAWSEDAIKTMRRLKKNMRTFYRSNSERTMPNVNRIVIGVNDEKKSAVILRDSPNHQEVTGIFWRSTLSATTELPVNRFGDRAADATERESTENGLTFRALEIPPDIKDAKKHIKILQDLNKKVKQKYPRQRRISSVTSLGIGQTPARCS